METAVRPGAMMVIERPAELSGDFDAVVRQYWAGVFRFVVAWVRDADAAGTLTQDCFVKAWRSRDRFRGECSLHTWLIRIAVNLVRDYGRNRRLQFWRRTRDAAVGLESIEWVPDRSASPEARALAGEQLGVVWKATGCLSWRQRTVFLLRYVEDLDVPEIAAATGMREGTVKAHLFRALAKIREEIRKAT